MKEMIKRIREDKGGFTLAELLIVVAIVLVLVAIAVPLFANAQTEAQAAVNAANERSVKAEATIDYLTHNNAFTIETYYVTQDGDIVKTAPTDPKATYEVKKDGDGADAVIIVTRK